MFDDSEQIDGENLARLHGAVGIDEPGQRQFLFAEQALHSGTIEQSNVGVAAELGEREILDVARRLDVGRANDGHFGGTGNGFRYGRLRLVRRLKALGELRRDRPEVHLAIFAGAGKRLTIGSEAHHPGLVLVRDDLERRLLFEAARVPQTHDPVVTRGRQHVPLGRVVHEEDAAAMAAHHGVLIQRHGVIQRDAAPVIADCEPLAVGRELQRTGNLLVKDRRRLVRGRVPDLEVAGVIPRRELFAVGRKRQCQHLLAMAFKGRNQLACGEIPEPQLAGLG